MLIQLFGKLPSKVFDTQFVGLDSSQVTGYDFSGRSSKLRFGTVGTLLASCIAVRVQFWGYFCTLLRHVDYTLL